MMTGFQAEENLTGRAPKKCAKNSGRYPQEDREAARVKVKMVIEKLEQLKLEKAAALVAWRSRRNLLLLRLSPDSLAQYPHK